VRPDARGRDDHQVLGDGLIIAGWVDDSEQPLSKLKTKAGQYGRPEAPLVTAVLCASSFMNDLEIEQALFGREAVLTPPGPEIEPRTIRQLAELLVRSSAHTRAGMTSTASRSSCR
jgi:hypothetical protein